MSAFNLFRKDDRGNVATIFALAMIPLIGMVGAAIDYGRVSQIRGKLADALDAGVLAVGSQPTMSDTAAYAMVNNWVTAHMGTGLAANWHLDTVTQVNGAITATASGSVNMTLTHILGISSVPISVKSQVLHSIGKVEIALVLDNTGSMAGAKLTNLKSAATALVDQLVAASPNPADVKIALVPFSMTVNVGSTYNAAAWLDTGALSPINDEIFTKASGTYHANRLTLFTQMGVAWGGCVESRQMPYDIQDTAPTTATPATLFTPFFAPDEPDSKAKSGNRNGSWTSYNDYETDGTYSTTNWKVPQGAIAKYNHAPSNGSNAPAGYGYGPNAGCSLAPLLRLSTGSSAQVKTAINAMTAIGDTNIPMGLVWGWHVLSPPLANGGDGIFGDGVPWNSTDWTKVVVLMTDGQNQNTPNSSPNDSYYSGIGYIWQNRIGVVAGSSDSQRQTALDNRLTALCTAMKAPAYNVVIYTVRVEVNSGTSTVLSNCATDGDKFLDVQDSSKLTTAFQNIGASIQKLRLAQ
jgi:Flp pilus assembly protein TadG